MTLTLVSYLVKTFFKSETTGLKEIIEELPETITKESKLEIIKYLESQGLTFKD